MLVRSARRRQQHTTQILAASFAQLNLPWLAPAQLRWSASQAARAAPQTSTTGRDGDRRIARPAQARHLATAADSMFASGTHSIETPSPYGGGFRNALQDKHIPWDASYQRPTAPSPGLLRSSLEPIILNTAAQSPSAVIKVHHGLVGTARELVAHLHTSLSVGRTDRAKMIIQRLTQESDSRAAEVTYAHNTYLEYRLNAMSEASRTQSTAILRHMQHWFEKELRAKDVAYDAKTLIIMIRAAILIMPPSSALDRSIRRYVDLARSLGTDAWEEVQDSEEYSDTEFNTVDDAMTNRNLYLSEPSSANVPADAAAQVAANPVSKFDPIPRDVDLPEVLATEQKGSGLQHIKRAMELFKDLPPLPPTAPLQERQQRALERQQRLEEASVELAVEKWRKADDDLRKIGIHTTMQSRPMGALMWQWYETLVPALEQELAAVRNCLSNDVIGELDRKTYGPYFELLPIGKMAAATILYTLSKISNGKDRVSGQHELGIRLASLTAGLGRLMEEEATAEISVAAMHNKRKFGGQSRKLNKTGGREARSKLSKMQSKAAVSAESANALEQLDWPLSVRVKLGAVLASKLIETAQLPVTREHPRTGKSVTQMQPAFMHRVKYQLGKKVGLLLPNEALVEKLQSEPVPSLLAKRMPMVVEPLPWSGWKEGGYLHYPNPILRLPAGDKTGKDYFFAADAKQDLDMVYKGLNALSKVPWKVNNDVFKVQLEAWNSGEAIANFAPLNPTFEQPPAPIATEDGNAYRLWLAEVRDMKNKESGLHSQRCFQNFQLEIARTMRNETMYFPHNLDFRGRAYPIPPYLNHMGADNARAMLVFAEGKPLGPDGLRWLKIHLATVAGFDKASIADRIDYTMSHLAEIRDSVERPLDGQRWWLKSEDAWQTLAACFELIHALDSPDPEQFISHLPVQQDGTCNGLQHYAALGGDRAGAAQVNLEPGDRPADVYTAVAEAVKSEVKKDAEAGHAIAMKLHGRITRKCVKQPVMTNVYGVTFYGAKAQVRKQLEVLFPEVSRHDEVNHDNMAQYVAHKIFLSLGTMFSGAQAIQQWLGQCADRITTSISPDQVEQLSNNNDPAKAILSAQKRKKQSKSRVPPGADNEHMRTAKPFFKSSVIWTTPLRLPVVQPYRVSKSRTITTTLQNLSLQEPQVWEPVSKRKQLQAFPPNFIHSLDATHMLLSALGCAEQGITFASVHDSFWTHASDVNTLSTVLRDQFIAMHSEDVIGRLREEFVTRYHDCMHLTTIDATSVVGRKIVALRKAREGRKWSTDQELRAERERLRLLASEDAAERAKGESLITPGSLVLAARGEDGLTLPPELAGQTLGAMPTANAVVEDVEATNADADDLVSDDALNLDAVVDGVDDVAMVAEESPVATDAAETKTEKEKKSRKLLYVWVPLMFPPVPKKGDFDVTRLRDSKYFFH